MIPKNAITMRGTIDRCWLVALRADIDQIRKALPTPLEPVEYGGFGYLGIVISHLSHMRPIPLPPQVGMAYWHAAYRIYARVPSEGVEGLYFLRSDADSRLMVQAGNLLTDFRFHRSAITATESEDRTELCVHSQDFPMDIALGRTPANLAPGSPFTSVEDAGRFLKYKPAGISVTSGHVDVMRIDREETAWRSELRPILGFKAPFLDSFAAVPEVAYEVEPIEYRWNRADHYPVSG